MTTPIWEQFGGKALVVGSDQALLERLRAYPRSLELRREIEQMYRLRVGGGAYQVRDWQLVDYNLVSYPFAEGPFRGQIGSAGSKYFVTLGSAATLGATSQITYSELITRRYGLACVNLGKGGAGPEYYLNHLGPDFWTLCNGAAFVIIEIMSMTSVSNTKFSIFKLTGTGSMATRGPEVIKAREYYVQLAREKKLSELDDIISENVSNYASQLDDLCRQIQAPKVLLWFSRRRPADIQMNSPAGWLAAAEQFPQFVDAKILDQLVAIEPRVSIVASNNGSSFAMDRFSYMPSVWWNGKLTQDYYPSPAMHVDAANVLQGDLRKFGLL